MHVDSLINHEAENAVLTCVEPGDGMRRILDALLPLLPPLHLHRSPFLLGDRERDRKEGRSEFGRDRAPLNRDEWPQRGALCTALYSGAITNL